MLADILPTGYEVGVLNGRVQPGDVVAVVGAGPVGTPATFELAAIVIRPGGHIANIGVHAKPSTLHLEQLWSRDVTITTGLVDTSSTPTLLRLATGHHLNIASFVTHHFPMRDFAAAFDTFARAAGTGALEVVLTPEARADLRP